MLNKKCILNIMGLGLIITFLLILLAPFGSAHKVTVKEANDKNEITIKKGETAVYILQVTNDDNVNYTVEVDVEADDDKDWSWKIHQENPFQINAKSEKSRALSVSTTSRFTGDMKEHEVVFTIRTEEGELVDQIENITLTTTLEIPEDEQKLEFWGVEVPLPDTIDKMGFRFGISFLVWVIIALIATVVLKIVLARLTKRTDTTVDDEILGVVQTPILLLVVLYGIVDSLIYLKLPLNIISKVKSVYDFGTMMISIWLVFRLFQIGLAFIGERWDKKQELQVKSTLIPLIDKLGRAILFIVVVMLILNFFGIDLTVFMAGAGIVGLVIAFAAQDTLANFFAGIFLIMEPKIKVNDTIGFDNEVYMVRKIGLRTSHLYDIIQNIDIIVPNHTLATSKLINLNEPDAKLRIRIDIPVAYGTDIDKLEKIIYDISNNHPNIITDVPLNPPNLFFDKFGDSSLDFYFIFWIRDLEERFQVKHEILKEIYQRLCAENIEIPWPQRVITLKDAAAPIPNNKDDGMQAQLDTYNSNQKNSNRSKIMRKKRLIK